MAALFPSWTNALIRAAIAVIALGVAALIIGPMLYVRSQYNTDEDRQLDQPVEFDHRHHVRDDGIDCLYCHPDAEKSAFAGVPATDVCMGCHGQIWRTSPLLEPVRRSYFSGTSIGWRRVYALADFVYFNHAVHVQGGVGCVRCHGRVDQMPRVYRTQALQMKWCLECHRDPHGTMESTPPPGTSGVLAGVAGSDLDPAIPSGRAIHRLTTCTACHR